MSLLVKKILCVDIIGKLLCYRAMSREIGVARAAVVVSGDLERVETCILAAHSLKRGYNEILLTEVHHIVYPEYLDVRAVAVANERDELVNARLEVLGVAALGLIVSSEVDNNEIGSARKVVLCLGVSEVGRAGVVFLLDIAVPACADTDTAPRRSGKRSCW